jgi:peptidoglycan/LPS O-acetylase OafA/YrhL
MASLAAAARLRQEERLRVERFIALLVGVLAWAAVAGIAVSVVNAWSDENQILAFLPIAAAVLVAWAIGEVVTDRVFETHEEVRGGGV